MKRLIVTADDFGLSPGVNQGIVDAHESGIVTATSLMVNAPAADEACEWARERTSIDIGLHFVLTFGRPVGPVWPLGEIVDESGSFRKRDAGPHEDVTPGHIGGELRAQLARFEAQVGRPPSHIDGHHHVHAIPGVLSAVIDEARERRIPVRSPDGTTLGRLRSVGIPTSDSFEESFYGEGNVGERQLVEILKALPEGTTELMCHPAREDAALDGLSSYVAPRRVECSTLTADRVKQALSDYDVELVPWTSR